MSEIVEAAWGGDAGMVETIVTFVTWVDRRCKEQGWTQLGDRNGKSERVIDEVLSRSESLRRESRNADTRGRCLTADGGQLRLLSVYQRFGKQARGVCSLVLPTSCATRL